MSRLIKFILALSILAALCLIYGFFVEPRTLKVRHITVQSDAVKSSHKIVLLSDIHIGGFHVGPKRVEKIVDRINDLQSDIVLIPGDFISGHEHRQNHSVEFNNEISEGLARLAALKSKLGVFASIGNHDVWYDAEFVEKTLTENSVTVLANDTYDIDNNTCLIGLADHDTQSEDISAFLKCEGKAIIAMMHSPDSFEYLRSDTALAVAGHTHGGQINIPLIGRRVTATAAGRKYAYGLINANGVPAFVTAGIGTSILPARFRASPELVVINLTP